MGKHNALSVEEEQDILARFDRYEHPIRIAADLKRSVPTIYRVLKNNDRDVPTIRGGYSQELSLQDRNRALALLAAGRSTEDVAHQLKTTAKALSPLKLQLDVIKLALQGKQTGEIARQTAQRITKVAKILKDAGFVQVKLWKRHERETSEQAAK